LCQNLWTTFQTSAATCAISLIGVNGIYTVSQNKTRTQSVSDNFGKYGPILIILSHLHSAINSGRSYCGIICHLTLNLLPHYLVKFECSTVESHRIVIQFKSVQSRLFPINIYSDVIISITCLRRCNVTACVQDIRYHHARHLSMDASMTRCSMLSQAFNRRCRNLLH